MQRTLENDFVNHAMYALHAPVITWPGYEKTVHDLVDKATMHRISRKNDYENHIVNDYEAMVYIHTVTFVTPISNSLYKVYLHLFSQFHDIRKVFGENAHVEPLDNNEQEMLHKLKLWIFKKQMEYMKKK